jgi:hypothetical protein
MTQKPKEEKAKINLTPKATVLSQEERVSSLKNALEKDKLFCTGDAVWTVVNGQAQPILKFIRIDDKTGAKGEDEDVWVATADNLPLFQDKEFFHFCREKAKEQFYKSLDRTLVNFKWTDSNAKA